MQKQRVRRNAFALGKKGDGLQQQPQPPGLPHYSQEQLFDMEPSPDEDPVILQVEEKQEEEEECEMNINCPHLTNEQVTGIK